MLSLNIVNHLTEQDVNIEQSESFNRIMTTEFYQRIEKIERTLYRFHNSKEKSNFFGSELQC